ncbi:MAG: hypothetical protein JWL72_2513 [Ilumatobacteraceae bacterium]|nr:hypothetical protein [Ilumatobacteraceae bacterium]
MAEETSHELARLFGAQHGLAADRQVRALGVSLKVQNRLVAEGAWRRVQPSVIAVAGSQPTFEQAAMAATLAVPGSMSAGRTAARLHRCDGYQRTTVIEVIVSMSRHPRELDGVTVRRSRMLSAKDRHTIDRIPVTTLPVTMIHLAANGDLSAAQALDGALRDGFHPRWLGDTFRRWKGRGVSGPSEMLKLLQERVDQRLPRSWFQRMAKDIFDLEGIVLVDEWPIYDVDGTHLADLDLADPSRKVGVECQSWEWHGSAEAQYRDELRKRTLTDLGWDIIDVWWRDLDRPASIVAHLRRSLARRS